MQTRLGWATILLFTAAALLTWGPFGQEGSSLHGFVIRMALLIGATWLAWNDLRKLNLWAVSAVILSVLIVARWPKFFLLIPIVFMVIYFLRPRQTKAQ